MSASRAEAPLAAPFSQGAHPVGCRDGLGSVRAADGVVQWHGVRPAADRRRDGARRARAAPVPVHLSDQAQGVASRDRNGHLCRGVPGCRAGHRPGHAGAAHLHHRAALHPAGSQPGVPA